MSASWTTDNLVERVKRKAQRPVTDLNFSDADILNVAEEELYTFLVPLIRTSRESFWLKSYSTAIVAGTASYRIPSAAVAGTIRDVWLTDGNGNGGQVPLVEPESRGRYLVSNMSSSPACACLVGDELVFYPSPNSSSPYTLTIWYEQRRPRLTSVAACALVSGSSTTTAFAITGTPSPALTVGQSVDVIEGQPNFDVLSSANTIATYSLPSLTLGTAVTSSTRVGAYICPTGYSCIVPLPDLFHFALVYATAAALCSEVNDFTGAGQLRGELQTRLANLSASIEPRVAGQAHVIMNSGSPLRRRGLGGWWSR